MSGTGRFRSRLAWLGRMPTRYRVLFGTQLVFFTIAIKVRLNDIEKARFQLEQQKQEEEKKKENGGKQR